MQLSNARRVLLFNYNEATGMIDVRHYGIGVKATGVSKAIKRVVNADIPDLSNYEDISDYILREAVASESDIEDGGESTVTLAQKYPGRNNRKNEQRAVRLHELGPRMTLQLLKIENGLCGGEVLYHRFSKFSLEEFSLLQKLITSVVLQYIKPRKKLKSQKGNDSGHYKRKRNDGGNKRPMLKERRRKKKHKKRRIRIMDQIMKIVMLVIWKKTEKNKSTFVKSICMRTVVATAVNSVKAERRRLSYRHLSTMSASLSPPTELLVERHVKYIESLDNRKDDLEYWLTEHLRLNGLYWGLTALDLMNHIDALPRENVIRYVASLQHENGGFGGHTGHDPHMLYTLSAVQILATLDALDAVDTEKIVECELRSFSKTLSKKKATKQKVYIIDIASLQNEDGSFSGDEWGEVDSRFSYTALSALSILKRLDAVNVDKAVEWVLRCRNYDGGFGSQPGSESHAGQIFCCVGALAITDSLHQVDADLLGWWLCERQLKNGGLNGRPEKLEDVSVQSNTFTRYTLTILPLQVCYSWWVLSSLSMLGRLHWIDKDKLISFILSAQVNRIIHIKQLVFNVN